MFKIKYVLIIIILLFCSKNLFAQTTIQEPQQSTDVPFRLFRTTNRWTFLKLDTITGRMWQLQYDTDGDARGSVVLNSRDLASGKTRIPGRFTLYPTQNIWTFILIDQIDGNTWQVQWSQESRNRFVLPID